MTRSSSYHPGTDGAASSVVLRASRADDDHNSHDAVLRVRRALRVREVGHTGTLDPMATGVLVLAVGEATKLVPWLTAQSKMYEASVALGIETDTLDADGREGTSSTRWTPPSFRGAWADAAELLRLACGRRGACRSRAGPRRAGPSGVFGDPRRR